MYCPNCGNLLEEESKFCGTCGNPIDYASFDIQRGPDETVIIPEYTDGNPQPAIQPKKPPRLGKILIIAACGLIVACGLFFGIKYVAIPYVTYWQAESDLKKGDYDKAVELYTKLGDFKDSQDKIQESKYQKGTNLIDQDDYSEAINIFDELGSYKDSEDKISECNYLLATDYFDNKNYSEAINYFTTAGDYKDAEDKIPECYFYIAEDDFSNGDYETAITNYQNAVDYTDVSGKILECKYQYAVQNEETSNTTTMQYLDELVDAGYKDSQSIYDSLVKWVITFVHNDDEYDTETDYLSFSKYTTVYTHILINGGSDGDSLTMKAICYWPNGEQQTLYWDSSFYSGSTPWLNHYYYDPSSAVTGQVKVEIYDDYSGELLATSSFTYTD